MLKKSTDVEKFVKEVTETFGGGSNFSSSIIEMAKEGYKQFIFFSDGYVEELALPDELDPRDQIWVNPSEERKTLPGKMVFI